MVLGQWREETSQVGHGKDIKTRRITVKKLYTTILIIAVTLFISCDEKKAEDDIKKALDKAVDVVDKATLTKPVFSEVSAPWDTVITFPKEPEHTYALKEAKTGVALTETTSGDTMEVAATQSAQNVIIVATVDGLTEESDPIEFRRKQGNALSFAQASRTTARGRNTFTQTATKSGGVAGDDRAIVYSINPTGKYGTIDSASGTATFVTQTGIWDITFTVTAELEQNEKYERATATYTLDIGVP